MNGGPSTTHATYESAATRIVLEIVAAACLSALGAGRGDVSELRKRAVAKVSATQLPGMDPFAASVAMSEIAERVDEIFAGIEDKMVSLPQPEETQDP